MRGCRADILWSSLLLKDCSPWRGPTAERSSEDCSPGGWSQAGVGERRGEAGAAERSWDGLTTTPAPRPPAPLGEGGRGVWDERVKLSLGRRGGGTGRKVVLVFSLFLTTLLYF